MFSHFIYHFSRMRITNWTRSESVYKAFNNILKFNLPEFGHLAWFAVSRLTIDIIFSVVFVVNGENSKTTVEETERVIFFLVVHNRVCEFASSYANRIIIKLSF